MSIKRYMLILVSWYYLDSFVAETTEQRPRALRNGQGQKKAWLETCKHSWDYAIGGKVEAAAEGREAGGGGAGGA